MSGSRAGTHDGIPVLPRLAAWPARRTWILWLVLLAGATTIVRVDIAQRREALYAEARTAHRLLSQATSRVDAVLGTLVLTAMPAGDTSGADATARLPAVYPQVLAAWRRDLPASWPPGAGGDALDAAESRSRSQPARQRHAAMAAVDAQRAHYTVVLAGPVASFALRIDARALVAPDEWPWGATASVNATLDWGGQVLVLQAAPGTHGPAGLTDGFEISKPLASTSQPFVLHVQRHTGPAEWPWPTLGWWASLCLVAFWLGQRWIDERSARKQAAEQVRVAQAGRLNAMGELAAGIAHELNQPLAAILASTQTAQRLLRELESEPDADGGETRSRTVAQALELAAAQARRASDVLARLRRLVQPGSAAAASRPVDVAEVARRLLAMSADDMNAAGIAVSVVGEAPPALADPVGVEQILHNLLGNAVQALRDAPGADRRIAVALSSGAGRVRCAVRDNGPGIAAQDLPRLFEPFFTTRPGGLGLGLPLCQTLALAMDGRIALKSSSAAGTVFEIELPVAGSDGGQR